MCDTMLPSSSWLKERINQRRRKKRLTLRQIKSNLVFSEHGSALQNVSKDENGFSNIGPNHCDYFILEKKKNTVEGAWYNAAH